MRALGVIATFALVANTCTGIEPATSAPWTTVLPAPLAAHAAARIKHVVVIMQENRSFDEYFGTFPGADGLTFTNGEPTVCVPDTSGGCVKPFHDPADKNAGGPHTERDAIAAVNGGKMDGFVRVQQEGRRRFCLDPNDPACAAGGTANDVMGWKDARDIPNYWAYAQTFVLQDRMFEPNASWSLPAHLFLVSEWSARCSDHRDALSCRDALQLPERVTPRSRDPYAWTDLTYLLHKKGVSWAYYLDEGPEPDCDDDEMVCPPPPQGQAPQQRAVVPSIWNPLPGFTTVREDGELGNVRPIDDIFGALKDDRLPAVSWVVPNGIHSEHPPGLVSEGQAYVTRIVNAIMRSSAWESTAIFLSWDDWGGFYDHAVPPKVDANGYGLRVPGLVISPYAKQGFVDHQTLSFDAYVKLIEDLFLGGQRLDPLTDGRPDRRPAVRENAPQLGDLLRAFDFEQRPRPPLILDPKPTPGPASR